MWSRCAVAIRRLYVAVPVAVVLFIALPQAAWGHAVLVSSDPQPGAVVRSTPSAVTLVFDEPLVPSLSRATVTSPAGTTYTSRVSGRTMRVPLGGDQHGVFRVSWRTVSEVDGHTIEGGFRFGVGAPVTGAAVTAPGPTDGDLGLSVLRGLEYAVLLLACGMALLDRVRRDLALDQPHVAVAAALLLTGFLVVGAEVVIAGSGLSTRATADYLGNGLTGWARVARLALEAALLAVAWWRGRLSVTLLAGIIGSVAVAGHGADVEPAWQGMAVNAAHLAAAGIWVGGILALALLRVRGTWPQIGPGVLAGFSSVAPWAFGASVLLGAVQAYQLLGSPEPVLHTTYGLTLVVKAVAVALMVPLSWLAWRRAREHLRGEAVLGVVVIGAAAALAAFPVVPKEALEATKEGATAVTQADELDAGAGAFPRSGDLTLGGRAGNVMVGLTVHPARPGPNTVTVYLATPATHTTRARVEVGGRSVDLTQCGVRCRTGTAQIIGRQRLSVRVSGQGTATYRLPRLPAPDGAALVRSALARMDGLRSYRVSEQLAGFDTRYVYQRPHRLFVRTRFGDGVHATLWLGRRLYQRVGDDSRWHLQSHGELAPVPYFPWYPFRPLVDAHVVGTARIDGGRTVEVSTFGGHGKKPESVWFTLYISSATHEVVESRMWAPNHFMRDRYEGIDEKVSLPRSSGTPR